MSKQTGTRPDRLGESDHLTEIAEILAEGVMRVEAYKSSQKPPEFEESSLHLAPDQSGDPPPYSAEVSP